MNVKGSMLSQLPASSGCTNAQMIAGTTWSTRLGLNVTDPESSRNLSSHRWYFLGPFQLLGLVNVYTLRTWKWPIIVDLPKKNGDFPELCTVYQSVSWVISPQVSQIPARCLLGRRDAHSPEDHVHDVTIHGILGGNDLFMDWWPCDGQKGSKMGGKLT